MRHLEVGVKKEGGFSAVVVRVKMERGGAHESSVGWVILVIEGVCQLPAKLSQPFFMLPAATLAMKYCKSV